jgi:hypothetical protein
MKIYLMLGMLITQASFANPEWNLKPKLEQRLSRALDVSSSYENTKENKGGVNFVTVGGDSTCDFRVGSNKIQNAINSGASEVRIASNDIYQELITINDPVVNLTIRGGFTSCSAAVSNIQSDLQQDWTEITRPVGQSGSIFTVTGLPADNLAIFENIKIVGGDGQGFTTGGSLSIVDTESDVVLQNVWLTNGFNMIQGGGLLVTSSNTTVILNNTHINNNQTVNNGINVPSGGGVYCNDFSGMNKFATIILNSSSSIALNHTQGSGGGASLNNRCLLASFAGYISSSLPLKNTQNPKESNGFTGISEGISLNEADIHGGGVYLSSGAGLLIHGTELCSLAGDCFGDLQNPASLEENRSNKDLSGDGLGGAIYATGENTDVTVSAARFNANQALISSGGAIAVFNKATLTINRNGRDCWDLISCNLFSENLAAFNGGVIYNNDATVNISHTVMQENQANFGVAIYSTNSGISNIDTSLFFNNGGAPGLLSNHLFVGNTSADYFFKYTTIADNNIQVGIFKIEDDPGTLLLLNSTIIDDVNSGPVLAFGLGSSGFVNGFCVMAHETSSLVGTSNTVDDPEFVDRANGDYHLSNTSPAIDYCGALTSSTNKDIDFQGLGWDNPDLSNFLGSYDIGMDENFSKNYLTIGSDAACDYDSTTQTIQDVIDTGVGEVRIAVNGFYDAPIVINNISVKLRGGYVDCNDALNDIVSNTKSSLIGTVGPVESIIDIRGGRFRNAITLENLNLSDSENSAITAINANAAIILNKVNIQQNNLVSGFSGGGIFMAGGDADFSLIDSFIINNSAQRGGGIYCSGSSLSISIQGDSGVSHNIAQDTGGGVYLSNACELTVYSGVSDPDASTNIGISDNLSYNQGGGIYADLAAQVTLYGHEFCDINGCVGNNTNPVNINNNTTGFLGSPSIDDRGAGIYATGQGTSVNIYAGLFKNNSSKFGGNAIAIELANLNVSRLSRDCWDTTRCNYFSNNTSTTSGATISSFQGQLNISSSYFEENTGAAIGASASFVRIEGSVFNNNNATGITDGSVISASNATTVEIIHSTFADNLIENSATFNVGSSSELRLYSSIVNDPLGLVLAPNIGTLTVNCAMTHEDTSFSGTNVLVGNPDFVDRDNRDYHLTAISPAKDMCDNSIAASQFNDMDFEKRGMDDPLIPNVVGSFDAGADEVLVELIFSNGFE